ncbi:MAG: class I SAM-dependent methyltransferase, partial [Planctomycetia bacterium]
MTQVMQAVERTRAAPVVACEFCGARCDPIYEVALGTDSSTMFRCARCSACRISPEFPAEAVRRLYEKVYFQADPGGLEKGRVLAADYLVKVLRAAGERPIAGRMLEIGAGYGFFARALAAKSGAAVDVVEPSESCRTSMREQGEPGTVYTSLDEVPARQQYDSIFCFHVMEHLQGCAGFFRTVAALLADHGRLFILTPNAASRSFRLTGPFWGWSGRDQHYQFLPQTFPADYWQKHGFRLLESRDIVPADHHYPSHWHAWARMQAARLDGDVHERGGGGSLGLRMKRGFYAWLARFVRQWPGYDGFTFERRWEELTRRAPHDELLLVVMKAEADEQAPG